MRALFLSLLALSACGGNWSNQDLEFLNAMPSKDALESKLPQPKSGLSGVNTRQQALMVGDPSTTYRDTRGASATFNAALEFILGTLEAVRSIEPTQRTKDSRIWGPYDDRANMGFEFQITITRVSATSFSFSFQHRKKGGTFFTSVSGTFQPSATLRRGRGELQINFKEAAQLPSAAVFQGVDQAHVAYVTDSYPTRVEITFTTAPNAVVTSGNFTYREQEDGAGQFRFNLKGPNADISSLDTLAAWKPSGAGKAVTTVTDGNFKGAQQTECWSDTFTVVYATQNWPNGVTVGDAATCATVP
ncbi:MAG: hypothetical protein K1X89_27205 [Myxococcaceae bacterium]|nr:hypothetical protein [Myxococcaceae bacterium]